MKMLFLSNDWILWFWAQYSMAIVAIPSIITGLLKVVAILMPSVKTDKIRDLVAIVTKYKGGTTWEKYNGQ